MNTLLEIKKYASERSNIRINGFGYINTRITRLPLKLLKGMLKQINNNDNASLNPDECEKIKIEVEFRQLCLSLRSVFDIKVR